MLLFEGPTISDKTRHFGMNENFGRENHIPQQIFSFAPYQFCFATKTPLMNPRSLQTTLSEGRGEEKYFCDIPCMGGVFDKSHAKFKNRT